MKKEIWLEALNNIKLFWQGATDYNRKSKALLIKESHNEMDEFILLCFGDMLGIPLRIIASTHGLQDGYVEVRERRTGMTVKVGKDKIPAVIEDLEKGRLPV